MVCNESMSDDQLVALRSLSYDAVVAALDNEDKLVVDAVTDLILHYTTKAGEALQQGKDYLPLLTPSATNCSLEVVAMEIVLEAFEEELDDC